MADFFTQEQFQEIKIKNKMEERKKILELVMTNGYELVCLGNDPKMKNKMMPMIENHAEILGDAVSSYCDAKNAYVEYMKEVAAKKEDNVKPFYAEKIQNAEDEYKKLSGYRFKLESRLRDLKEDKTK